MLDEAFQKAVSSLTSSVMGTETVSPFLYDLVMLSRPRSILEIGGGLSTIYLLKALADSTERLNSERPLAKEEGSLLYPRYFEAPIPAAKLHMIDSFKNKNTTAGSVAAFAKDLGIDEPLHVHNANFMGYESKLPKQDIPFDMVWFDCGKLENYTYFHHNYWPLIRKDGGLILMHSLATNHHGVIFLKELRLAQATTSFNEFEMLTLVEPHKQRQNSITLIRLIGEQPIRLLSVLP